MALQLLGNRSCISSAMRLLNARQRICVSGMASAISTKSRGLGRTGKSVDEDIVGGGASAIDDCKLLFGWSEDHFRLTMNCYIYANLALHSGCIVCIEQ
jgi:hypothetical protein